MRIVIITDLHYRNTVMKPFVKNKNDTVRVLVLCGLFTALITVGTMISIPIAAGQGFINLGDSVIHTAVYAVGGWQCAAIAAVGSALADLFLGFPVFVPASFIIKGIMALIGMLLAKRIKHMYLCFAISGLIVPIGYFFYELLLSLFKVWDVSVAIYDIPWNFMQYLVGAVIGSVIVAVLGKVGAINKPQ